MKATKEALKEQIIERLHSMSHDNLQNVEEFINSMREGKHSKEITLSFSGKWKDMDTEIFQDLTENLQKKRMEGRNRIYE